MFLVPTFYEMGKNGPCILKNIKKSHNFFRYKE
jgi:hypothetical protein